MSDYLTREDVMKILKLNERKVKALFNTEGFPGIKIGRDWCVRADKLDAWLEANEGKCVKVDYSKG